MLLLVTIHTEAADFETATEAVKNMGLGWNLGNTLEAHAQSVLDVTNEHFWGQQDLNSETCWGQYPTKPELLKMMKDAGFGAIRVPVTWYNHMDKNGKVDAAWMARVHEVVDYVINQGMYCILNVHHDTGADSYQDGKLTGYHWIKADADNYTANKTRYESLWTQIAEEFKDYGQSLLFEGYNEMLDLNSNWNFAKTSTAYDAINSYAKSFVTAVRATGGNNAQRNLVVTTYCAANGYGTWDSHLKDPLTKLNNPESGGNHIVFEVHAYPNIQNGTIASVKADVDGMITLLKNELVSKGGPVIIGEWGTSNVDKTGETDYDVRRDKLFEFATYFVQKCKENNIGTFYWMGLTDGLTRFFPAFSQADLAKTLLQAYHGSDYNPTLPERSDYGSISCTANFNQQYSELYLFKGSITSSDYIRLNLELEEAPASGMFQLKAYYGNNQTAVKSITSASSFYSITANLGTVTGITLQCLKSTGTAKIKSVMLKKKSGSTDPSDPSVFWGCTVSDIKLASTTGISSTVLDEKQNNDLIFDLNGRQLSNPQKGIYIRNGKKYVNK